VQQSRVILLSRGGRRAAGAVARRLHQVIHWAWVPAPFNFRCRRRGSRKHGRLAWSVCVHGHLACSQGLFRF